MDAMKIKPTLLELIEIERRYPGLMDDLNTEAWQRALIKELINTDGE